ncbi:MAG TPA: aminotransferase class III-fold pyridoxal phosphate-dependent enzyme [Candidatus Binataceae bacterium]|nr:aminotransferase class III-fold pyridoxal phosphate-dependent enzyme [Candidatus Binataceae bacterium]
MNAIEDRYRALTPGSAAIAKRAESVMPGGDTRSVAFYRPYPIAIDRGEGAFLCDVDGNRYFDLLGNYTSLVHGNAYPPIIDAIRREAARGTAWPARSEAQTALAAMLCERVKSVERVRFCNSGTEAGMLAAQLARRVTGRKFILMARFGYHGSYDDLEIGLAGHDGERTILADFGDADRFEAILSERGSEIAAVFLEPVLGSGGVVPPPPAFLSRVCEAARRAGAVFVLDEVITLRLSVGGAQEMYDVAPDLTMMGKIIGGGLPAGALGGSAELMAAFDPRGRNPMWHSGTFNGNPLTCAAGLVSVRELTRERIETMDRLGEKLAQGLKEAARNVEVPFSVRRVGSLMNVFFLSEPPGPTIARKDAAMITNFHLAALNHGLFIAPRGMIALSTVMTYDDVDQVIEHAGEAMRDVAAQSDIG